MDHRARFINKLKEAVYAKTNFGGGVLILKTRLRWFSWRELNFELEVNKWNLWELE